MGEEQPMIQRYTPRVHPSGHVDMVPDPDGEFLKYADLVKAVFIVDRRAIDSQLREALTRIRVDGRLIATPPKLGSFPSDVTEPPPWDVPEPQRWDEPIRDVFQSMNEWKPPRPPEWVDYLRWSRESTLPHAQEGEE